jgi:hypothetical protein
MTASFIDPVQRELDENAIPVSGAKLRFFVSATTTPLPVYQDSALSIAHAQPILSDSFGYYPRVFLPQGLYKRTRHTTLDVLIASDDNIDTGVSAGSGAIAIANGGTGATTAALARSNLGVPATSVTAALDGRLTGVETIVNAPSTRPLEVITYAANVALDFVAKENQVITLTGNITLDAPTVTAGTSGVIVLIQDGSGARTAVWNAAYKFPSGTAPALSRAANAIDVFSWYARTSSEIQITAIKKQDPGPIGQPDILIEDRKSSGTAGGTATSGSFEARALNTEVFDRINGAAVAGNQVTLSIPGTYYFEWESPVFDVGNHASRLYNVTTSTEVARGSGTTATNSGGVSHGAGTATITGPTVFQIESRVQTTKATSGFGSANSFGSEVYSRLKIWKAL